MPLTREEIAAQIRAAFEATPAPAADDLLAAGPRASVDAIELAIAIEGKHWSEVPLRDIVRNREMVAALGPIGFRGYAAAFLIAGLSSPDVFDYTLFALLPVDDLELELTRVRLSLLDCSQQAAIVEWLRYFADHDRHARRALAAFAAAR